MTPGILLYLAGVAVGLGRTDAPLARRIPLALAWPVGAAACVVTIAALAAASLILFPAAGAAAAGAAVLWWFFG